MEFIAQIEHLNAMMDYIRSAFVTTNISASTQRKIELICEEALVNIINYAYGDSKSDGKVDIEWEKKGSDYLEIVLTDEGVAFNPIDHISTVDVNEPLSERKVGGLGIFLLSKLSSELHYERADGKNILTIGVRYQLPR